VEGRAVNAADVVASRAARWGIAIPPYAAEDIAEAVLNHSDETLQYQQQVPAELWRGDDRFREHERRYMRQKVLAEIVDRGRLPTSLPKETIETDSNPFWQPGHLTIVLKCGVRDAHLETGALMDRLGRDGTL
jgi:hypothetical protein